MKRQRLDLFPATLCDYRLRLEAAPLKLEVDTLDQRGGGGLPPPIGGGSIEAIAELASVSGH